MSIEGARGKSGGRRSRRFARSLWRARTATTIHLSADKRHALKGAILAESGGGIYGFDLDQAEPSERVEQLVLTSGIPYPPEAKAKRSYAEGLERAHTAADRPNFQTLQRACWQSDQATSAIPGTRVP